MEHRTGGEDGQTINDHRLAQPCRDRCFDLRRLGRQRRRQLERQLRTCRNGDLAKARLRRGCGTRNRFRASTCRWSRGRRPRPRRRRRRSRLGPGCGRCRGRCRRSLRSSCLLRHGGRFGGRIGRVLTSSFARDRKSRAEKRGRNPMGFHVFSIPLRAVSSRIGPTGPLGEDAHFREFRTVSQLQK
jgi:hypothetical protein